MTNEELLAELGQIRGAITGAENEPGANSALKAGALLDMLIERIRGEDPPIEILRNLDADARADIAAHPEGGEDLSGPAGMEHLDGGGQ